MLCNTHCFSTTTMVARTRPNVTLYVHCLSCYTYFYNVFPSAVVSEEFLSRIWHLKSCIHYFLISACRDTGFANPNDLCRRLECNVHIVELHLSLSLSRWLLIFFALFPNCLFLSWEGYIPHFTPMQNPGSVRVWKSSRYRNLYNYK